MTYQGWDGPGVYAAQLGEPVRVDPSMPAPQVGIVPLRPLGVGDILSGAFKAVRFNPAVMFGLTLLIVLVGQLLAALAGVVLGDGSSTATAESFDDFGLSVSLFSSAGFNYLAVALANMPLMYATAQAVLARPVPPAEAFRRLGQRAAPALALLALLVGVVALPVAGIAFGFATAANTAGPGAVLGLTGLLFVVGAPVAILLTIRLGFAPCVIAVEGLGPIESARRSWQLTRGLFWRLLGITLLVNLIVTMAAGTISQVVTLAATLVAMNVAVDLTLLLVTTVATVVSAVLTLPLTASATTLLYVDARIRSEGFDITLSEAMYG